MAVLPGATSNRPTPGGMPDSRQMSKVGPAPSMPKMGAGPAELGSVAGVPNPLFFKASFSSSSSICFPAVSIAPKSKFSVY